MFSFSHLWEPPSSFGVPFVHDTISINTRSCVCDDLLVFFRRVLDVRAHGRQSILICHGSVSLKSNTQLFQAVLLTSERLSFVGESLHSPNWRAIATAGSGQRWFDRSIAIFCCHDTKKMAIATYVSRAFFVCAFAVVINMIKGTLLFAFCASLSSAPKSLSVVRLGL